MKSTAIPTDNYAAPYKGFGESVRTFFAKYAVFRGRASRSEYWWSVLFSSLVVLGAPLFAIALPGMFSEEGIITFMALATMALFLPTLAVSVRRLHDTGSSGWGLLVYFIPVIGPIIVVVWMVSKGKTERTKFD